MPYTSKVFSSQDYARLASLEARSVKIWLCRNGWKKNSELSARYSVREWWELGGPEIQNKYIVQSVPVEDGRSDWLNELFFCLFGIHDQYPRDILEEMYSIQRDGQETLTVGEKVLYWRYGATGILQIFSDGGFGTAFSPGARVELDSGKNAWFPLKFLAKVNP